MLGIRISWMRHLIRDCTTDYNMRIIKVTQLRGDIIPMYKEAKKCTAELECQIEKEDEEEEKGKWKRQKIDKGFST